MPCLLDVWQYGLNTTPRLEWNWAVKLEWKGEKVSDTMGGYVKEGWSSFSDQEDHKLRRKAVSIQQLQTDSSLTYTYTSFQHQHQHMHARMRSCDDQDG